MGMPALHTQAGRPSLIVLQPLFELLVIVLQTPQSLLLSFALASPPIDISLYQQCHESSLFLPDRFTISDFISSSLQNTRSIFNSSPLRSFFRSLPVSTDHNKCLSLFLISTSIQSPPLA
ncbi:hypothetical protein PGT21_004018 [Puccinia graminis f. sp. tritici]|uniref:Uncharacterized protein n=1 Tax=Puccinia graminis f. sp. tritici TaxID=56615 RepID=A0A5B0QHD0_PUCGR|nr:hypothetical protein PGT21_004018 [Puccinia graminis f. sp. tritici]